MENWIVQNRRKICIACEAVKTCAVMPASIFKEQSDCPKSLHSPRHEEIAARAWPAGVETISGCCDTADP